MCKRKIPPEIIYANSVLTDAFSGEIRVFVNNKTVFIDASDGFLIEVYKHDNKTFRVETHSSGVHDGNQFCSFKDIVPTVKHAISSAEPEDGKINSHVGGPDSVYVYSDLKDHYKKNVQLFHGIVKFSLN